MNACDASLPAYGAFFEPESGKDDASQVERALDWLSRNFERQPSLAEAADHVGLSEYHFQRRFRREVGLSPKKYVQFLTLERAKHVLAQSRSVLDAAYASGLSGPGRLHDLFVNVEAMTPGEYKNRSCSRGTHDSVRHSPVAVRTLRDHAHRPRRVRARVRVPDAIRRGAGFPCPRIRISHLRRRFGSHRRHREDALRRVPSRRRLHAARPRHPIPDQGVACASDDSRGLRRILRRPRSSRRSTRRVTRGRQCARVQPSGLDHSVPSDHSSIGRARRVPVGQGTQACDAEPGGRGGRTVTSGNRFRSPACCLSGACPRAF